MRPLANSKWTYVHIQTVVDLSIDSFSAVANAATAQSIPNSFLVSLKFLLCTLLNKNITVEDNAVLKTLFEKGISSSLW
jgi:hypothetical protein